MNIKDRVRELRRVKGSALRPNPKNWRTHPTEQADAMRGVLAEIGFAGAALARELPDGSLMLIDGHLRAETAPEAEIPVLVLDVTEAEADKLLATFDPIGALAGADSGKLDELLRGLEFDSLAVGAMIESLKVETGIISSQVVDGEANDPAEHYQGMPEFHQDDQSGSQKISVHFDSFADVKEFCRRLELPEPTEKTRSVWFPYKAPIDGKSYTAGSE